MFARRSFINAAAVAFAAVSVMVGAHAFAQSATLQPSATDITETTAVIRWTTDVESTTVVQYGTTAALGHEYKKIVPMEEAEATERTHSMTLWELTAGTTYFYRVESSVDGSTSTSSVHQFTTLSKTVACTADEWR